MKNKNLIILLFTILIILSAVSLAAYSYFSATVITNSSAVINTTTPNGVATFTTSGGTANVIISASSMSEQSAGTNGSLAGSGNTTLKISLLGTDDSEVSCSYNLYLKLTSNDTYVQTGSKEFTYTITNSNVTGDSEDITKTNTTTNTPSFTETQINGTIATTGNDNKGMLITSKQKNKIFNSSDTVPTEVSYTVTIKFYNLSQSQSTDIQGKSFITKVYVADVYC